MCDEMPQVGPTQRSPTPQQGTRLPPRRLTEVAGRQQQPLQVVRVGCIVAEVRLDMRRALLPGLTEGWRAISTCRAVMGI